MGQDCIQKAVPKSFPLVNQFNLSIGGLDQIS